jgi:hypothetical protein
MLPPMAMDRGMGAGGAEDQARLNEFRRRHKGMGWFYRLLDVPYGIEMATDDVSRFSTPAALTAALVFDSMIAFLFGLIWWRYDLMSTWTTLDPLANGLTTAFNTLLAGLSMPEQVGAVVGWVVAFAVRLVVTLGPSIIQFRMPYDASRHDAAWLALWATAVFDMATDSVDVRADIPMFFGWLIEAAQNADNAVWISLMVLGIILLIFRFHQWPMWAGLIAVSIACLGWDQAGNVVFWANVGFWTIFASFAAQSLFFIYAAKVMMLFWKRAALGRARA